MLTKPGLRLKNMRRRRSDHEGFSKQKGLQTTDKDFVIDDEVSHLIRLRSEPCDSTRSAIGAGRKVPISPFKLLSARESNCLGTGRFSASDRAYVLQQHLPVKGPWYVDSMDSEAYVSQFTVDGSLLIAGFRGSRIKIYDVDNNWKVRKDISCQSLRWTISDIAVSPDQRFLVYSSLSPIVHIVNTAGSESHANITDIHEGLVFSDDDDEDYVFGIFSVEFSSDGRELVAGNNNDSIYVYDLSANKVSLRLQAHKADVNTVAFADETGHILFSGSDDSLCKVWDRRCLVKQKPAGVLTGHLDGITFIDSRRDGRYFISNCKDQSIKLWDIRKMSCKVKASVPRAYDWDYRYMKYPSEARHMKHPHDQSLATFKGHSVLCTLIRCYFSPSYSTGQRYIYTGSSDKYVYIYDTLTGEVVERLSWHGSIIRDCNWHPYNPVLVSSSWDGYVTRWEAAGEDDPLILSKENQRHCHSFMHSFAL